MGLEMVAVAVALAAPPLFLRRLTKWFISIYFMVGPSALELFYPPLVCITFFFTKTKGHGIVCI